MKKIYICGGDCGKCPYYVSMPCYYKYERKLKKGDKINIKPSKNRTSYDPISPKVRRRNT